ncbi:hypothetical protein [Raoultella terrigena]|uniref:hypothetical protein n=1 Tax=Raoultella terrigena TaxID=577 RepID=UPI001756D9AD|nr:hypothetical protein [Escherichia coli]
MSFVNNITYKKRPLPEAATSENFCTKDLEFFCPFYVVSEEGRLLKDNQDGSYTDLNFTGKLYVNCEDKDYNAYWFSFDETGNLYEISLILDE